MKTYTHDSLFLSHHKAIELFVESYSPQSLWQGFTIICERKEDLEPIRRQVFYEIRKRYTDNSTPRLDFSDDVLGGITTHHLDSLAQHLYTLADAAQETETPYLDIAAQEKLLELLLRLVGYQSSDCLSIAKQLLILIDAPWPQDESFFSFLVSGNKKNIQEKSLRQLLAVYQMGREILSSYARFQSVLGEGIFDVFFQESKENFLPKEIFLNRVLWIAAPEYAIENREETFKPGNFQAYLVNDFLEKIRNIRAEQGLENFFLHARTVLTIRPQEQKFSLDISSNLINFYHKTRELIENKKENELILLGDFQVGKFKQIRRDAAGSYTVKEKDIAEFFSRIKKGEKFSDNENETSAFASLFRQIQEKFDDFLATFSLLPSSLTALQNIAQTYELSLLLPQEETISQLFLQSALYSSVSLGTPHPSAECESVLSFLPGTSPEKIYVVGKAHPFLAPSFLVKTLNQVLFLFQRQTGVLDAPSHESIFRGYWNHMASLGIPITFFLESPEEALLFPKYLDLTQALWIRENNRDIESNFVTSLAKRIQEGLTIKNWQKLFNGKATYSVTEFESFVTCPLSFFLKKILNLEYKTQDIIGINNLELGSKMHKILEVFMRRTTLIFGNSFHPENNKETVMQKFYATLLEQCEDENFMTSQEKASWQQAFADITKKLKEDELFQEISEQEWRHVTHLFDEVIALLWSQENTHTASALERELLKRSFKRFLHEEKQALANYTSAQTKVASQIEEPVLFSLHNAKFSGKIDRVDRDNEGLHIIDYKTSKVSHEKDVVLFPSEKRANKESLLSVQGALYAYHFAKKQEQNKDDDFPQQLKAFSLYKLRSLDFSVSAQQSYHFSQFNNAQEFIAKVEEEYSPYVELLEQGCFQPRPLLSVTESPYFSPCNFCDFNALCPYEKQPPLTEDEA